MQWFFPLTAMVPKYRLPTVDWIFPLWTFYGLIIIDVATQNYRYYLLSLGRFVIELIMRGVKDGCTFCHCVVRIKCRRVELPYRARKTDDSIAPRIWGIEFLFSGNTLYAASRFRKAGFSYL